MKEGFAETGARLTAARTCFIGGILIRIKPLPSHISVCGMDHVE